MPLVDGNVYVICSELTYAVLDFACRAAEKGFARGWGWDEGENQKWKAIKVGKKWTLQNQQSDNDQRSFISPHMRDAHPDENYRFVGGIVPCEFRIKETPENSGKYIISYRGKAVSLVTGANVHKIKLRDGALDLHANGPPIALQPSVDNDKAQIWSFRPAAGFTVTEPLANGTYKIVNFTTGTVLGIITDNDSNLNSVHGLAPKGEVNHKWIITREANRDRYTFRSSIVTDHFLAPDAVELWTALIGRRATGSQPAQFFTVRKVLNTRRYKIFLDGLAVNLAFVNGSLNSADGAAARLQASRAQEWYFVLVQ